jgi:hypothetical protein
MYEVNTTFEQPENENVKVWRYMGFTKFVSLIESRCLYFTRADKLDDPFEGSWPLMNVLARQQNIPEGITSESREAILKEIAKIGEFTRLYPKFNAINCWHMNEHESAAMWKLYLKSDEGIAVQSTYNKLRASITDDETVFLGVVKYIDYETEMIDMHNYLNLFVHKRKSFEHEREVRALVRKIPKSLTQETIEHGVKIKVDVENLVEQIFIAPSAPRWFSDLVRAITQRYGYIFNVVHSKLDEEPLF